MPNKYKGEERRRPHNGNRDQWTEEKRTSFQKTVKNLEPVFAYYMSAPGPKKKKKVYSWTDLPLIGDSEEEEEEEEKE